MGQDLVTVHSSNGPCPAQRSEARMAPEGSPEDSLGPGTPGETAVLSKLPALPLVSKC